ncbi:MAG TPA: galactokinase family protein, partial [Gaiellaceae bacterium]
MTERVFRAPGRVNLIGEHTDYNDGFVLPMAIDLECLVRARPRNDALVKVDSGAEPYAAALVEALGRRGRPSAGIDATITSTVPRGAGLSSSAALEVALALALCDAAGFELPPLELALACREAEELATGVPCGIMDQLTSVAGRAGCALLIDCR